MSQWVKIVYQFIFLSIVLIYSAASMASAPAPLPADQAFVFSVTIDPTTRVVKTEWHIAPDYYLYRDKFNFKLTPATPFTAQYPATSWLIDKNTQHHEVYSGHLTIPLVMTTNAKTLNLVVNYQGCSKGGFCYPPVQKNMTLNLADHSVTSLAVVPDDFLSLNNLLTDQNSVASVLHVNNVMTLLFIFLGLGLLLAFTPCIFPMVPILTSIVVGHQQPVTTMRAFSLSATYVLGMAIAYALAGLVVAALGESMQVWLQNPWVIGMSSFLFVVLACSMFGLFDLRLPRYWHNYVAYWSYEQKGGTFVGVFLMGVLSTLIVSPCVTAPLVGVLIYIAQTGNLWLGAGALFVMGIGMGIPLLIVGMSAGKWLPKSGAWMEAVKKSFGLVMLAMAIWLSSRVMPGGMINIAWALFGLFAVAFVGIYLPTLIGQKILTRMMAAVILVGGTAHLVNVTNVFRHENPTIISTNHSFTPVKNLEQINHYLNDAQKSHHPIILDFYADWCEACVAMDKQVFSQSTIQQALSGFTLLRVDLSANTVTDQEILKHFRVIAPPTMVFFDSEGTEVDARRVVGELSASELLSRINGFYAQGCDKKASC